MSHPNAAFEGSIPDNYDKFLGPVLFEPYAIDLASRIPKDSVSSVLELACGTGRATNHVRKAIPEQVKLVATDLSPDMIRVAKSQVPHPGIEWCTADMQSLPFDNGQFDAVICQFGLMFVQDKGKAFREVCRVLKPGGTFLFNTWDKIDNIGVMSIANRVITRFFENRPPVFYSIPFSMYKPDELRTLPLKNGFSSVDVLLVKKVGRSNTALEAARGVVEGSPIYNEIKAKDHTAISTIMELLQKEIAASLGDKPVISPLQAWVGEAVK